MSGYIPSVFQQKNTTLKEQFAQEQAHDTRENTRIAEEKYQQDPSDKNAFDLAQWLTTSTSEYDKERGVQLLKGLLATDPNNVGYLYYLASGHYKLQNYVEAKKYADMLLAIQPNNRQAMSLKSLAEEKVAKDGLIGMMIVGGAAAAVVSGALLLLKAKR